MRGKLSLLVAVLLFSNVVLTVSVAEEEPGGPPEGTPYIKHWTVNPPWSYIDSIIYFWCIYYDPDNRTIDSAKLFIDNIPFDLEHNTTNTTLENPRRGVNFTYQAEQPWERKTYEFYFSIRTGLIYSNTSIGTFDIVNREPYLLETPPTRLDVAEEFEWEARAFDADLDYISWSQTSNLTDSGEWEWEASNVTAKLKIKCNAVEKGWINVTIWDNYTGIDYWNWSLTCYPANSGKSEPPPPRSVNNLFLSGEPTPEPSMELPKPLSEPIVEPSLSEPREPNPGPRATKTWNGGGAPYNDDLNLVVETPDGHELDWDPLGAGDHYIEVDDPVGSPDDDSSYVSATKGNYEDYWSVDDHTTESGTISNVRVYIRAKQTNSEEMGICIYSGGTEDCTADIAVDTDWTDYYNDWATDPNTGSAWQWSAIDAMEIGVISDAVGGWTGTMYVTQGYAVVTHEITPDILWSNSENWSPTGVPQDGDDVVFDTTSTYGCTIDENTNQLDSLLFDTGYTGTVSLGAYSLFVDYTADGSDITGTQGTLDAGTGYIYNTGDWDTSSASFTFTDGTSKIIRTGTGTMTTRDSATYGIYDIYIETGDTTTASSQVWVSGTLTVNGTVAGLYWRMVGTTPLAWNGGTGPTARIEFGTQADIVVPGGTVYGFSAHMGNGYKLTLSAALTTDYFSIYRSGYYSASGSTTLDTDGYDMTVAGNLVASAVGYSGGSRPGYMICDDSTIDINGLGINIFVDSYIDFVDSVWTVAGDWTVTSSDAGWDEGGALVTFDEAGDQDIDNNGLDFHHVVIAGSGTKSFTDDVDIDRMWIDSTLTQDAATLITVTDKGNITNNGTFNINGGITHSSADWWDFFSTGTVNTLNSACILYVDIRRPFTYTIAASTNTTIENISIESPASQTTNGIYWVDWADKDTSGDHFLIMNTTQTSGTVGYTISNLTDGNDYDIYIDDGYTTTKTADASNQIYYPHSSWSTKEVEFTRATPNTPPTIDDPIIEEHWWHNDSYVHRWNATDPDADTWTWSLEYSPDSPVLGWIGIEYSENPTISAWVNGTCPFSDIGLNWAMWTNVSDGTDSASDSWTLYCENHAPSIDDPITEEHWTQGVAMAHQWNSTDADSDTNAWDLDGDPGYLSLQQGYRTAWVNGTCTDAGKSHPIYLNVTDGYAADQETFTLYCDAAPAVTEFYFFGYVNADWDNAANWEPTSASDFPQDADDSAYIVSGDCSITEGASLSLTIGYFQINSTYTDTVTSVLHLIVDSSGTKNGSIAADGSNTWNIAGFNINLDGNFYIGDTTISNPATTTFQGGVTQNLQSGGETLYSMVVDNVASTILYLKDDAIFFQITIQAAGTFEIDAISESKAITLQFSDLANAGFVSTSSGQNTFQGDGTYGVTIESTGSPPTNRWSNSGYNIKTDATYTTFSYFSIYRISDYGDTIANSLFEQYNDEVEITQNPDLDDNTFDNGFDAMVIETDCNRLNNMVVTNENRMSIATTSGVEAEMVDSNFNKATVGVAGAGNAAVISQNHNDVADAWTIIPHDYPISQMITKFGTGDTVEIYWVSAYGTEDGEFILDQDVQVHKIKIATGATFQIGQDTPTASRTLTFDDAGGAGFDSDTAGLLKTTGTATYEMYITSVNTPPTNYWLGSMISDDPDITMTYTTISYHSYFASGGDWDIDHITFDYSKAGSGAFQVHSGGTVTNCGNITVTNSDTGPFLQNAFNGYYNIDVSAVTTTQLEISNNKIEMRYSNFDPAKVNLFGPSSLVSKYHNDSATHWLLILNDVLSKSQIKNDFEAGEDVQIFGGSGFTINENAESGNVSIEYVGWGTPEVIQNAGTTWSIGDNANVTINGTYSTSGTMDKSGVPWYFIWVNYGGEIIMSDATITNADILMSFPYTVSANSYGVLDELTITQPVGADNYANITQRDFSVKGSGTVITFFSNNSASATNGFIVDNLTNGNDYDVTLNGTTIYTLTAAGGQISWSNTSEGIQEFAVTYSANVSGAVTPPGNGSVTSKHLWIDLSYESIDYRTFDFNSNVRGTDPPFSFDWDFGDGITSDQRNPNHQYDLGFSLWKDYTVKLTVEDSARRTAQDDVSFRVYNWPVIFIVAFIIGICLVGLVIAIRSKE